MKRMKKLASLLLALVMVFALTTTAFAEETTYSITINNSAEGHTYEAYQIFTGDLSGTTLSNIEWGSSVTNSASLDDAATVAEKLDTNYTGEGKLTVNDLLEMITLSNPVADSGETSNPYVISGLAAGYYLVKDQDGSLTGDNDSYTEYIIKVVSDTTATPKSDVPTVQKKVKDINNSTDDAMTDWQDSADHDIGDSVPFQLKATLADNVSSYTTYKVVFHDTLSKGLTYNNDAKVYIDDEETDGFTVEATVNTDGTTTLTVSCDDVTELGAGNSAVITVEYTATLNDKAVIGSAGNPNKVYLEYSNNPNKSEAGNNETGKTPEDKVIVFTYKTIINKVDEKGESLTGAAFKLEKLIKGVDGAEDTWEVVKEFTIDEENPASSFEFTGLDDGTYKLTETKTPAGYNTIDPITFTITATHSEGAEPALTELSGNKVTGEITFTSKTTDGSLSADVVNKAGSTLPETGGMGTTIFYVVGGILVVGAAVLLITKRRMNRGE